MKSRHQGLIGALLIVFSSFVVVAGSVSPAQAGEGWGLPIWNPFSSASSSKAKTSRPRAIARQTQSPSTWTQITRKTSSVWTDTKHTVMPWTKPSTSSRTSTRLTGSRPSPQSNASKSNASRKGQGSDASSGSWLSWLWGEEEKPQRPLTVSDWIIQPKPE